MSTIIDGRALAERMRASCKERIARLKTKPGLAIVQVGENPESTLYVKLKERAAGELGMLFEKRLLPANAPFEKIQSVISELNAREDIHGIIVQLPLPDHLDAKKVLSLVALGKDVDGLHPTFQQAVLHKKRTPWLPALHHSILALLDAAHARYRGSTALILAKSEELRQSLGAVLARRGCAVRSAATKELAGSALGQADLLITALGTPGSIRDEELKTNAICIDVGLTKRIDGSVAGDFSPSNTSPNVAAYSPVPGGIGPVTVASVLTNTITACRMQTARSPLSFRIQPETIMWFLPVCALAIAPFLFGGEDYRGRAILFILFSLTGFLWWFTNPTRLRVRWWRNPDMWLMGFVLVAALSSALAPAWRQSMEHLAVLVLAALAYVIGRSAPQARHRVIAWMLVGGGVALALWSDWMFFIQTDAYSRVYGPFKNPDGLAAALLIPLILSIGLARTSARIRERVWAVAGIVICGVTLALTSAVSSLVGLVGATAFALWVYRPRIHRAFFGACLLLVCVGVGAVALRSFATLPEGSSLLTGFARGGAAASFTQRISFVRSSVAMFVDHPFLGTGLGSWSDVYPQYQRSLIERTELAHGTLPQYLGELGAIGLVVFVLLCGATVALFFRGAQNPNRPPLAPYLATGCVALLIAGAIDIPWFYPALACTFWYIAGIASSQHATPLATRRAKITFRVVGTAMALLLLGFGVVRCITSYFVTEAERSAANSGDFIDSIATAELAMRYLPTPNEELRMSMVLMEKAWSPPDRAELKRWAEQTLRNNPLQPAVYLLLGRVVGSEGDTTRAAELYTEGLERDPHFIPDLAADLAALYVDAGRHEEAISIATVQPERTGLDVPNRNISLSTLAFVKARAELSLNRRDDARASLFHALALNPGNEKATALLEKEFPQ